MGSLKFALSAAVFLSCITPVCAADNWVGAWGYVPNTPPPGQTPVVPPLGGPRSTAPLPMSVPPAPAAASPAGPPAPRLENPGNLAILPGNADPANVTIRELVRVSVAGKQIRLRFSNESGVDVMAVGAVHVAQAGADGSIVPGSDHAVTFDGQPGVVLPASAPLLSDPISMPVKALDRLLISIHLPGPVPRGGHSLYQYVASTAGDNGAAISLPGAKLMRATALVTEVDVNADIPTNAIVALGDSITEGQESTANAFHSWPDRLAERLVAARKNWTVINTGIGGNRLLRYGNGMSMLARLDRDVLSVPGIKAIILLAGINDIGRSFVPTGPVEPVTLEALQAADKQIIARAHAKGIKVYAGLVLPYLGNPLASPEGDKMRQALNNWIRTSGIFDGVIDFASAVADPTNLTALNAPYNSRDFVHPNDDGYQVMANTIDLNLVTGK